MLGRSLDQNVLMQKIAEQIGWPDTELFNESAAGGNATRLRGLTFFRWD